MLLTRHSNLKDELSIWGIDSYQRTGVQSNVTDTFFFCFCHLYPSIQHICAIVWMPFNVLIMLYWSTQHLLLYVRKYPHSKDSLYWEQPNRRTEAGLILFFSQATSFKTEGQLWQKPKKSSQMCFRCSRTGKKSKVRNLKRVWVWGEGFLSQSSSLSSFSLLFLSWCL